MYDPTGASQQNQPTYPSSYPPPPPPAQRPKRRRRGCLIAIVVIVILAACGGIAAAVSSQNGASTLTDTPTATTAAQSVQTPQATTKPAVWTTVQTIKGNGSKKTGNITVPDSWKIVWSCDHASFQGLDYNVIVSVYNSDGTLADIAINTLCKKGNTSGETEEHQGGNIYLDVNCEAAFTLKIQELI